MLADAGGGPWGPNQTVAATFQSACPRNSLGKRGSFLTVERLAGGGGSWEVVSALEIRPCFLRGMSLSKRTSCHQPPLDPAAGADWHGRWSNCNCSQETAHLLERGKESNAVGFLPAM